MRAGTLILFLFLVSCSGPQAPVPEPAQRSTKGSEPISVSSSPSVPVVIQGDRGAVKVMAEVANTPVLRARGLMYREALADGHGMLFVYQRRDVHTFWMKNTLIPLDMLFMDGPPHQESVSVIGIVHEAEPETLAHRSVPAPSLYVLEVPGGWARKMGISVGSRVSWEALPEVSGEAL